MFNRYFKREKLLSFLFVISFFIGIALFFIFARKETPKYRVLLIHSFFEQNFSWKDEMNKGVYDCFKDNNMSVDVRTFYLDAEFLSAQQELDTLSLLLQEYDNKPLDLILVCDDQATFSLLATKHPLTYKVPIVFSGVDYVNNGVLEGHSNVTGFTTKPDFVKCYNLAERLFGRIDDIAIIAEDTYLGKMSANEARQQFEQLPEVATIYNSFPSYSKTDTIHPLGSMPHPLHIRIERVDSQEARMLKWILFYRLHSCCILPKWSPFYSSLASMGTAPFLMVNNEGFGDGRIGGYMTPSYNQTYDATNIGVKILRGAKASDFPIVASKQYPVFDWVQLKYWKIDLDSLPQDSIIPNMPFGVKYKKAILASIISSALFIVILMFILLRLYKREALKKKQVQQKLSKEQLELGITIEALEEGVVYIDRKGNVLSMNESALKWLKLDGSPDVYIKKNVRNLFYIQEDGNPFYLQNMMEHLSQQQSSRKLNDTAVIVTADKRVFPVSGSVSCTFKDGNLDGAIISFRDITDESMEKELLALSMIAGDVFAWRYDSYGDYVMFDESFFRSFNIPDNGLHAIMIQKFKSIIHPDDYGWWKKTIKGFYSGKISKSTIQIRQDFNGEGYQWWEYRIASLPKSSLGNHYKLFGLCLNIEKFKKIEEELVRVLDEARESDRLKSLFLANMSHEVRTPLNAIVGFSSLLIEEEGLSIESRKDFINIINENCRLLLNLINEILDISRIESGILFREETCNLTDIVRDSIESNLPNCPTTIEMQMDIPEEPVSFISDPFRLKQLLDNLIDNAFKFTKVGKVIVGYILAEEGSRINLFVKDTGIGISETEKDKIFERFYKSDDFVQGGGLGLSICKEIVKRMEGTIHVESEVNKGTCFIIDIPFRKGKVMNEREIIENV
ncbi:ATP-binding protein [Parabacteroides bouchesdurhonensis]|uniref:sensor histidine kinase n=2 Tax=Parabacteroides bouchesdurhonensis TaxID=1936995 RepID=UPI000E4CDF55|nr:ATP-binding protein [Parabacteroides bouchesdurhonensis]RHJ90536.1 PAS domain-containing protein [Bacteroides sp. AM07-16]